MASPITIKKYGNRRLYDTSRSRYINLEELASLVREGGDIEVRDAKTGEDLTREVLMQVLLEVLRGQDLLPVSMLHRMIRATGDSPWQRGLYRQLAAGLRFVTEQLDQMEQAFGWAQAPRTSWPLEGFDAFSGMGLPTGWAAGARGGGDRGRTRSPSEPAGAAEPEPPPESPQGVPDEKSPSEASEEGELADLRSRLADLERRLKS